MMPTIRQRPPENWSSPQREFGRSEPAGRERLAHQDDICAVFIQSKHPAQERRAAEGRKEIRDTKAPRIRSSGSESWICDHPER
jgi:hypothetical protein